jgi:hypothetical protein
VDFESLLNSNLHGRRCWAWIGECEAEAERGEYAGINRWRERDSFIEMWRFVVPGQIIAKYLPSFIEYPPMQEGGSFSIQDLKEKVEAAQRAAQAGSQ